MSECYKDGFAGVRCKTSIQIKWGQTDKLKSEVLMSG